MEYRPLGRTDLKVSALCLGTMTWGEQNSEQDAFAQIARAKAAGINFMDTAEMYPVPPRAETYASTERIIGNWFRRSSDRADWILASKIAGPGNGISHVRDGNLKFNRQHIVAALDASLERLQTDWLDLYQLHWPERRTNFFGQLGYQHQEESFTPLEETLEVLDEQVRAGKIRHIGLSNETPWGTMTFLRLAEERGWPRAVSIQNPYNLLNRSFEVGLAEIAIREQCGLLAYSPMAFGMLSGKYADGARPANARISLYSRFTRGGSGLRALRGAGPRTWNGTGADGTGLRHFAAVRDQQHHRRDLAGTAGNQSRQHRPEAGRGGARRYRCDPPGATEPGSLRLQGPGAAAGSADNRAMRSSAPPGDQARFTGPAR